MEPVSIKRIDKIFSDMRRKYLESREELRKSIEGREKFFSLFMNFASAQIRGG